MGYRENKSLLADESGEYCGHALMGKWRESQYFNSGVYKIIPNRCFVEMPCRTYQLLVVLR